MMANVRLLVKAGSNATAVEETAARGGRPVVCQRINEREQMVWADMPTNKVIDWFCADLNTGAPFPEGALLCYFWIGERDATIGRIRAGAF